MGDLTRKAVVYHLDYQSRYHALALDHEFHDRSHDGKKQKTRNKKQEGKNKKDEKGEKIKRKKKNVTCIHA